MSVDNFSVTIMNHGDPSVGIAARSIELTLDEWDKDNDEIDRVREVLRKMGQDLWADGFRVSVFFNFNDKEG